MKKYAVYPGYIRSKYDGDKHFITARKLIQLYGADPKECVVVDDFRRDVKRLGAEKLIGLRPLYDSNYREVMEALENKG